jgi:release factor glutamine methyltransferase
MRIAEVLVRAAQILESTSTTPRLDAELLLAHTLGWERVRTLAERASPLTEAQRAAFDALVARRMALEPVAYITGHKEFYGLDFVVSPAVLVPRPETELLVELALLVARRRTQDERRMTNDGGGSGRGDRETRRQGDDGRQTIDNGQPLIADVGTGSGCIAVTLAVYLPQALVYATDVSPEALAVARHNALKHGVDGRMHLVEGDLLEPLEAQFDLIMSNPPYTILSEIDENVRRHEPRLALDGGPDGLALYRRLLAAAPATLRPGGAVLLEIGATQGAAVADLARQYFPSTQIAIYKDLAGLDRVVVIDFGF